METTKQLVKQLTSGRGVDLPVSTHVEFPVPQSSRRTSLWDIILKRRRKKTNHAVEEEDITGLWWRSLWAAAALSALAGIALCIFLVLQAPSGHVLEDSVALNDTIKMHMENETVFALFETAAKDDDAIDEVFAQNDNVSALDDHGLRGHS